MLVSECRPTTPRLRSRKYTCDEAYFSALSPERAYWLGFIMADGCVTIRKPYGCLQFMLVVASKDREHLEKLKAAMQCDRPLYGPQKGCYALAIPSYPLCRSLEEWGVVPRKSYELKMPALPRELECYLYRGLVDGDGSFNVYHRPSRATKRNGRGRPATDGQDILSLALVGSHDIVSAFQYEFGGSIHRKARVWEACVTGQRAADAIRWMYADDTVPSLDRKRNRAVSLGLVEVTNAEFVI